MKRNRSMPKILSLLGMVLVIQSYSDTDETFFNRDSVYFSESKEILDSSFGPLKGISAVKWVTKSVSYQHNDQYILKINSIRKEYSNVEADFCNMDISAFKANENHSYDSVWTMKSNDCSCALGDLVSTTEYGCCDAEDVNSFYSAKTARFIVKGTSSLIPIPNTNLKVIYFGKNGVSYDRSNKNDGLFFLLENEAILDSVDVNHVGTPWTPKIKANFDKYLQSEKKLISLEFDEGTHKIFVVGNRFEIPIDEEKVFSHH